MARGEVQTWYEAACAQRAVYKARIPGTMQPACESERSMGSESPPGWDQGEASQELRMQNLRGHSLLGLCEYKVGT